MTSPRDVPAPRTPHFARGIALRAMQALFVLAIVAGSAERSSGSSQDSRFYNGTWSPLSIGNPVPPRREMCFAYDPVRDRIIHIAGSQTWALVFNPSPQWVSLNVPASFEGDERGFYDAIGDRIVVVTGSMDVYALSAGNPTTWEHLFPSGTKPPSRSYFAAAHDTYRNRVLIFGGAANHDTWALSLGAQTSWSQLPVSGVTPPPVGAAAAYDPRGDRMLVFGGSADFTYVVQDVLWELPLSAPVVWNPLDVPEPRPQGRVFSSMIFDPGGLRLVLYGGYAGGALSDVWELSLDNSPTWTEMWPLGPTPLARWSNGLAYRSGGPAMIAYGGLDGAWLTDGWSLSMPEVVLAPHVYSFTPLGGRVGDLVILSGAGLSDVSEVTFAGVPAVIEAASYMQVRTRVPAGATTGRIRVVSPEGAGESPADFFVGETPVIASAVPDSGRYGDVIRLSGLHFSTATNVVLGSGGSAPFTLIDDATMDVVVDSLATTGRISVTTLAATGTSEFDFRRLIPVVLSATPDSGVVGDDIQLLGQHFTGATRVTIGGTGSARFTVDSDTRITFTLDSLASTGVVSVRVPGAVGVGSFTFYRRAPELRPNVRAVRDVAGDQGGRVVVAWRASDLDREPYRAITGYRVWRRVVLGPNTQLNAGSLPMRPSPTSAESATSEYWESVAELPAAFLRGYAYAAATLRDSLPGDNPYTAFFVQALTNDPFTFYNSNVDSGYSVDNLAPPTPGPFSVVYASNGNTLHWTLRTTADFREFRLYRGSDAGFTPGEASLIAALADTSYIDLPGAFYYKLVAVDLHGNTSHVAAVSPEQPVATLAALVDASVLADRVRLTWLSGGNPALAATVYRRTEATSWVAVAELLADGRGYLRFEDSDVEPGARYGYRLGIDEPEVGEVFVGEAWVTIETPRFALAGVRPNPAPAGRASVEFVLEDSAPARMELFDLSGRRLEAREVGSLGAGRHSIDLSAGSQLPPGLYFLRLSSSGAMRGMRVAVVE